MLKIHRDCIRQNFTALVKDIPFIEVLAYLHQSNIFNTFMVEDLLHHQPSDRNIYLLLEIQTRGPLAFAALVGALTHTGKIDLVNRLRPYLQD